MASTSKMPPQFRGVLAQNPEVVLRLANVDVRLHDSVGQAELLQPQVLRNGRSGRSLHSRWPLRQHGPVAAPPPGAAGGSTGVTSDAAASSDVALAERPAQMVFELAHAAPVGVARVVHAQQVQNPVDEQLTELGLERHAASSRLALGGIE